MWQDIIGAFSNNIYFIFLSYLLLGGGLKYIDDAFDKKSFNKKKGLVLAPFLGLLWAFTMIGNPFSATVLLAVVLGVLSKGKIDNPAHVFGFIVILMTIIFIRIDILVLPLIFLSAAAIVDEAGNDVTGYDKRIKRSKKFRHKFFVYFFGRRYLLKVALLYLVLINVFPMYLLIALILFDEAYLIVEMYSDSIRGSR
ncbi:MAG TPA: hypothetical protein ENI51_10025 [Candidatus Atribacteria bacterium]|nr:hypothetical protein [Candidatus Atribacteria bacterium]